MSKFRYVCLAIDACAVVPLGSCVVNTPKADKSSPSTTANPASQDQTATHSSHNIKQININSDILSELDKFEAKVNTDFTASMTAVDGAIAALPTTQRTKPAFTLQVINGLLDATNSH